MLALHCQFDNGPGPWINGTYQSLYPLNMQCKNHAHVCFAWPLSVLSEKRNCAHPIATTKVTCLLHEEKEINPLSKNLFLIVSRVCVPIDPILHPRKVGVLCTSRRNSSFSCTCVCVFVCERERDRERETISSLANPSQASKPSIGGGWVFIFTAPDLKRTLNDPAACVL